MTKLYTALFAVALAGAASAAKTPETITFEATRAGNVTFPHKLHAARGCKGCHPAAPSKLNLDKEKAHALCKGCHERLSKGPNKCDGCHTH
ncbi:MAG: cytochrome C [Anaeromyxobacteraceae bacterium]